MNFDNPVTMIGAVAFCITAFIGLIVWLVKEAFKRQSEITDRYFGFLEEISHHQQQKNKEFLATLDKYSAAMELQSELLKDIHSKVNDAKCRHQGGSQ
jgi:hypothetical protein